MIDTTHAPAGAPCSLCGGAGVTPQPIPVQRAYLDGPLVGPDTIVVQIGAHAGLDESNGHAGDFFRQLQIKEREALLDMPDGLLLEHIARLHRMLVMASEDGLEGWFLEMARARFEMAHKQLSWRKRASEKGAPLVDRTAEWRERVQKVRDDVDLAMLIAYECDGAKPAGLGKWVCRCPFHADKSASMSIDVARGLWHCFGCNAGGDAFTYAELRFGLDFASAVRHLEQRL